jgi:hypothetical protein
MLTLAAVSTALFGLSLAVYYAVPRSVLLALCITFGVCAYHFVMRLAVGYTIHAVFRNRMNVNRRWFRPRRFEAKLYARLGVGKWKRHVPTYAPDTFSPREHSWEELAQATCQAEVVHEVIMVLSFVPLALIPRFGEAAVFILTSVMAACIDLAFVILQRYNRPRILKLVNKQGSKR